MSTIVVRSDGSAPNLAAATIGTGGDPSSASSALDWDGVVSNAASINAGDIIELYDNGGLYTQESGSSGAIIRIPSSLSGTAGNPIIIRKAATGSPVVRSNNALYGINWEVDTNYTDVDLDVTHRGTVAAIHTEGRSGIAGDGYTNVYRGTITGRAGAGDDADGISLDNTTGLTADFAERSELHGIGATVQDVQLITPAGGSPQAMTPHNECRLKMTNCSILRCNQVFQQGSSGGASLEFIGGTVTDWYGGGFENGSNSGLVHVNGANITQNEAPTLFSSTINGTFEGILFENNTITLNSTSQVSQGNNSITFRGNTLNLNGASSFQIRQLTNNNTLTFVDNVVNVTGAMPGNLTRFQNNTSMVVEGNTFDYSAATGSGNLCAANGVPTTYSLFANNKIIGASAGSNLTFTAEDFIIINNTWVNINANRAIDIVVNTNDAVILNNIFSNVTGVNGAYLGGTAPTIDYNNYSNGTADEGDDSSSTLDPALNSNYEPTNALVFQGARSSSGGTGARSIQGFIQG